MNSRTRRRDTSVEFTELYTKGFDDDKIETHKREGKWSHLKFKRASGGAYVDLNLLAATERISIPRMVSVFYKITPWPSHFLKRHG